MGGLQKAQPQLASGLHDHQSPSLYPGPRDPGSPQHIHLGRSQPTSHPSPLLHPEEKRHSTYAVSSVVTIATCGY